MIQDVKCVNQKDAMDCEPACMAMVVRHYGSSPYLRHLLREHFGKLSDIHLVISFMLVTFAVLKETAKTRAPILGAFNGLAVSLFTITSPENVARSAILAHLNQMC